MVDFSHQRHRPPGGYLYPALQPGVLLHTSPFQRQDHLCRLPQSIFQRLDDRCDLMVHSYSEGRVQHIIRINVKRKQALALFDCYGRRITASPVSFFILKRQGISYAASSINRHHRRLQPGAFLPCCHHEALEHCASHLGIRVEIAWLPTRQLEQDSIALERFNGLWCAPGSPYQSMSGRFKGDSLCPGIECSLSRHLRRLSARGTGIHPQCSGLGGRPARRVRPLCPG